MQSLDSAQATKPRSRLLHLPVGRVVSGMYFVFSQVFNTNAQRQLDSMAIIHAERYDSVAAANPPLNPLKLQAVWRASANVFIHDRLLFGFQRISAPLGEALSHRSHAQRKLTAADLPAKSNIHSVKSLYHVTVVTLAKNSERRSLLVIFRSVLLRTKVSWCVSSYFIYSVYTLKIFHLLITPYARFCSQQF
jgi:hypothetical protein